MALLSRLAQVLSQFLPKMEVFELLNLLDTYFSNCLPEKEPLEVLATELVKRGHEASLTDLGKAFFRLTLMGHRSKILATFCLNKNAEAYHPEEKRVQE